MSETRPTRTGRRDRARGLRRDATEAEKRLWWHLRHRLPLERTYFRRQVPLGPRFADFCCLGLKLIVEVDGGQHGQPHAIAYDGARTAFLEEQGFEVLRFWNDQIFSEIDGVLDTIAAVIARRDHLSPTLTPGPSPQGRAEISSGTPSTVTSHTYGSSSG